MWNFYGNFGFIYTSLVVILFVAKYEKKVVRQRHTLSKDFSFIFRKQTNGPLLNSVSAVINIYSVVFKRQN